MTQAKDLLDLSFLVRGAILDEAFNPEVTPRGYN